MMKNVQSYKWIIRQAIRALLPGVSYELRFDQIGDVFPPGMVGDSAHRKTLLDVFTFAEDAGCIATQDDKLKAFVFRRPK
jgi:hypothetical protein